MVLGPRAGVGNGHDVGLVVHAAGRLVHLTDAGKVTEGAADAVRVNRVLCVDKSKAVILGQVGLVGSHDAIVIIPEAGRNSHHVVLVVHVPGGLVRLTDAGEGTEGLIDRVGVDIKVGSQVPEIIGLFHRGFRHGGDSPLGGDHRRGHDVALVVGKTGRLVGLADAGEVIEGLFDRIRVNGQQTKSPNLRS